MASKIRRDMQADLPRYPLVTPEGIVKMVAVASNVKGALVMEEGSVMLSRFHEKQGWQLLQRMYVNEGRADLWAAWESHQAALQEARRRGQSIPAFPAEYLPAEIHRRRAGIRPNVHAWTMPELPPVVVDAPAKPAARVKKDVP